MRSSGDDVGGVCLPLRTYINRFKRLRIRRTTLKTHPNAPHTTSAIAVTQAPQPTPKSPTLVTKVEVAPALSVLDCTAPVLSKTANAAIKNIAPSPKRNPWSPQFDLALWEHQSVGHVFKVTLDRSVAQQCGHRTVWLKGLAEELGVEETVLLTVDIANKLLVARLMLDQSAISNDRDHRRVLAHLPVQGTVLDYLVACWNRLNSARDLLIRKSYSTRGKTSIEMAKARLDSIRHLLISYVGLTFQEINMFPQPSGRPLGPPELVARLLTLSSQTSHFEESESYLTESQITEFIRDLVHHFEPENKLDGIFRPVVKGLLFHQSLFRPEGISGSKVRWRGVIHGLELLIEVKSIAVMLTRMPEWNPSGAKASDFERVSLMGPLCRLGVLAREWPNIAEKYFPQPDKLPQHAIDDTFSHLRSALKTLQSSLFRIFNTLARASEESSEAVLQYFARVISLNVRRVGMQVDPDTVASDSFMVNLQSVLFRLSEVTFMHPKHEVMSRIDPLYFHTSSRIRLKDSETRINATAAEVAEWEKEHGWVPSPPNYATDIFFLTVTMSHYGYFKIIETYASLSKRVAELQRSIDVLNDGYPSWIGGLEYIINDLKDEQAQVKARQMTFKIQLLESDLLSLSIRFSCFLCTWWILQAHPKETHPSPVVVIPLAKDVPVHFRALPEYILEDMIDYLVFAIPLASEKFERAGKLELMTFLLVFLSSTWYIKNPFLKSKINDVLFMSILSYGGKSSILGACLHTDPVALMHLMPTLMHYYIDVEQTGSNSQFYDKFHARRNIADVFKCLWNNPTHRMALNKEAQNVDKFVRFVNLMMNDVTYLLNESLSQLIQIHTIEAEMEDQAAWNSKTLEYRRQRENTLDVLDLQTGGYTCLSRSTVELLKMFTAETEAPFMVPEIVDRLAAMLGHNLHVLAGPKYQDLRVKNPKRYNFDPKVLLSDLMQIFLNLGGRGEFVEAVAGDGRSYSRELFECAAGIAERRGLKSQVEIAAFLALVGRIEKRRGEIEEEEEGLGEVPDEFLDPVMATVMRDPVILPVSKKVVDRSTIKSILLSDGKDPFNRVPLTIEEVVPDTVLQTRIDAFLGQKRGKKMAGEMEDGDAGGNDCAKAERGDEDWVGSPNTSRHERLDLVWVLVPARD